MIMQANGSCQMLIKDVLRHFPSFNDCTTYNGKTGATLRAKQLIFNNYQLAKWFILRCRVVFLSL
jgi:hypothetical protein